MSMGPLYDAIGTTYSATRREDPRLAATVWSGLGAAETVVNVGAGTGSYEPRDRRIVLAVEPSATMIAQRPADAAPVLQAAAERLPLPDAAFDAAMAVLTDHHWSDRAGGLRELRRVAGRAVVLTYDSAMADRYWAVRDYFPGFLGLRELTLADLVDALGGPHAVRVQPVPIPADCIDGFWLAWWRRPEALLDPRVRAGISVFSRLDPDEVRDGVARLAADLQSGDWARRNAELLGRDELDLGLRLLVAG
jgi:SAM-dependent methyltransferase